jgi:hypothetical protein
VPGGRESREPDTALADSVKERADAVAIGGDILLVVCGHTHGGGEIQVSENIRVLTGEAEYGKPRVNGILEIE